MKKTLLFLVSLLTVVSCYDDSSLWEELRDHEERIAALETLCAQMNTNVSSLQAIVTALQENDYVTAFAPIKEGDRTIGYTITFSKAGSFTIYNGKDGQNGTDGKDGADGKDAVAPVIGVKEDADGSYYWTVDGEWLLDEDGNKVCASGKDGEKGGPGQNGSTPQLKVEDGYWYVSYDGKAWTKLDAVAGTSTGLNVTVEGSYVLLTLDKDTVIRMPMVTGVPEMTVEIGFRRFVFRGKTTPLAPDYVVGVLMERSEEDLAEEVVWGFEGNRGYSYEFGADGSFEFDVEMSRESEVDVYYYRTFVRANGIFTYGDVKTVAPNDAEMNYEMTKGADRSLTFAGNVTLANPEDVSVYVEVSNESQNYSGSVAVNDDGTFSLVLTDVEIDRYYYAIGVDFGDEDHSDRKMVESGIINLNDFYGTDESLSIDSATDLVSGGLSESSNCYIVSSAGSYKFPLRKGNSSDYIYNAESAVILWESDGTTEAVAKNDLIKGVNLNSGQVVFQTADTFKEGNAVIAVLDGDDRILWSWHIWMTDAPAEQIYYYYDSASGTFTSEVAGVMMDRNLGATSASSSDGAATYGLLYQWGRKDPFLGSAGNSSLAQSTVTWPGAVSGNPGDLDYVISHPMKMANMDYWSSMIYYRGSDFWNSNKGFFDPCPPGWRVPDNQYWPIFINAGFEVADNYRYEDGGIAFTNKDNVEYWYPIPAYRSEYDNYSFEGIWVEYWLSEKSSMFISNFGNGPIVSFNQNHNQMTRAYPVRCQKDVITK